MAANLNHPTWQPLGTLIAVDVVNDSTAVLPTRPWPMGGVE